MEIIYALLPLFIFFIIVTRILQFFLRMLGKIQQEQEDRGQRGEKPEKSRPSQTDSRKKRGDSSPSRSRQGSSPGRGIPEGFELDLSDIDDKFGKETSSEQKSREEAQTTFEPEISVASLKAEKKRKEARQQRDSQDELQVVRLEGTGSPAGGEPVKALSRDDLALTRNNFVRAMVFREIISRPRSSRPYRFSYRRRD